MPPEAMLLDLTVGQARTQIVAAVAELGIADVLRKRSMTSAEVAREARTDPDATHRLLRAATAYDICRMNARTGTVRLTRIGRVLCTEHPRSLRNWAVYMGLRSTSEAWSDLAASVRTGESAFPRVHGTSVWEWLSRHPHEEALFGRAMRELATTNADAIASAYPWPQNATVCDVGGGIGTLLAAVLENRRDLRGVLVDAPGPISESEKYLAKRGMASRADRVVGSIFQPTQIVADVYLLKDILHDWDDPRCAQILRNVAAAMPSGSNLVVVELVQELNVAHPLAPIVDLQMLTQTDGGRQRTLDELNSLLRHAGLRPTGSVYSAITHSLLEARKQ